jgi:hypothetical protein
MPKDTSLGLPWMTRDRGLAHDYLRRAERIKDPKDIYPCVLYWRGQPKGFREIPKQRVVWGFDHAETIIGATILYPALYTLKRRNGFAAWNDDLEVDKAMTRILEGAQGRRIVSMDYSGFDSSLSVELLNRVDRVLMHWFEPSAAARIQLVGEISNTVDLVVPFEVLTGRNGGMPSGSVLTNLRDTIANLIAGFYIAIRNEVSLLDYEVLGDDAVFLFSKNLDPEVIASTVSELGLKSNPEKQYVSSESAHFLQRLHMLHYKLDGHCRGVRSPYRAMSGILGYERFRQNWSKWMDSARWIMQMENVRWDPRFIDFVKFIRDGDKVLKEGIDPATIFSKAGGATKVREVLHISSFPFNQQNPERVKEFETTRILRSFI